MIKTDIVLPLKYNTSLIKESIGAALGFPTSEIGEVRIVKRTLDLSAERAAYRTTVAFSVGEERRAGLLKMRKRVSEYPDFSYTTPAFMGKMRPVVVGAGPAGLFAALTLAEAGARPILLERGLDVTERKKKVEQFCRFGILDGECNVQFGEGGAGTYSDGKLKVGAMDKYKMKVLSTFVECGADEDILFSSTAHLGTDRLAHIISKIRERIITGGGEIRFGAKVNDIIVDNDRLTGVSYSQNGTDVTIEADSVIIAVGHSARDTIDMLYNKGLKMTAKGFGVGMRIEHPREYINSIVYGSHADQIDQTASYHLVTHLPSGRSVYSFCMCPGGSVVAAAGEVGGIVTNGMSEHARMGDNSNAAILVSVTPADFGSDHPLAGIEYQRRIERRAYSLTSDYRAPTQRLGDFLRSEKSTSLGDTLPSYARGTELHAADDYLPDYITDSIRGGVSDFDAWMSGFSYADAVFTGPETRTTSPVRMLRDDRHTAEGYEGIYPAGEGAGYAGGIVSSAVDGIRTAERLIEHFGG